MMPTVTTRSRYILVGGVSDGRRGRARDDGRPAQKKGGTHLLIILLSVLPALSMCPSASCN